MLGFTYDSKKKKKYINQKEINMKEIVKSKLFLGVILSAAILILSNCSIVCAADEAWPEIGNSAEDTSSGSGTAGDDIFSNMSDENWATPETENIKNNTSNELNNSTNETNVVFNVSNSNNITNSLNSTTSNSNSLAKTGITDSNGMFAVILIVCGIVAVYSFKKISDYKNM